MLGFQLTVASLIKITFRISCWPYRLQEAFSFLFQPVSSWSKRKQQPINVPAAILPLRLSNEWQVAPLLLEGGK